VGQQVRREGVASLDQVLDPVEELVVGQGVDRGVVHGASLAKTT